MITSVVNNGRSAINVLNKLDDSQPMRLLILLASLYWNQIEPDEESLLIARELLQIFNKILKSEEDWKLVFKSVEADNFAFFEGVINVLKYQDKNVCIALNVMAHTLNDLCKISGDYSNPIDLTI